MNTQGYDWDSHNAAAALLYASVIDGIIYESQMTPQGYRAMNWAEYFLLKLDTATTQAQA